MTLRLFLNESRSLLKHWSKCCQHDRARYNFVYMMTPPNIASGWNFQKPSPTFQSYIVVSDIYVPWDPVHLKSIPRVLIKSRYEWRRLTLGHCLFGAVENALAIIKFEVCPEKKSISVDLDKFASYKIVFNQRFSVNN